MVGYLIYGLDGARCPKCGTLFDPDSVPTGALPATETTRWWPMVVAAIAATAVYVWA